MPGPVGPPAAAPRRFGASSSCTSFVSTPTGLADGLGRGGLPVLRTSPLLLGSPAPLARIRRQPHDWFARATCQREAATIFIMIGRRAARVDGVARACRRRADDVAA